MWTVVPSATVKRGGLRWLVRPGDRGQTAQAAASVPLGPNPEPREEPPQNAHQQPLTDRCRAASAVDGSSTAKGRLPVWKATALRKELGTGGPGGWHGVRSAGW